ncbi:MipA/OmpV family protein [Photobacterium sp. SDRW27]|uniref:MipA/OmpV family protein n=1 Tax=Photobacterium obscurum TaxID=2829490 RepID=UPI002244DD7F|nr:MipA/OmpV family protein [Photobacterium obscurum]MCW8332105.1 MipA/OmpV family protein [Photobacterium obscurum]
MKKAALFLLYLVTSANTSAGEFSLVAVTSYSPAVYKGLGSNVTQFSMLGYEGRHLYLRGTHAGYSLYPLGSPLNLILGAGFDPRTLHPEDSTHADIQKLDKRKAGVFGGVTIQGSSQAGVLEFSIGSDLAGNHNGVYSEVVWKLPIVHGLHTVVPELGYAYYSKKLNNHLYGVSTEEAKKTEFDEFVAGGNGMFFIGMRTQFRLFRKVSILTSIRYSNLDPGLSKSPIIESSSSVSAVLGFIYIL